MCGNKWWNNNNYSYLQQSEIFYKIVQQSTTVYDSLRQSTTFHNIPQHFTTFHNIPQHSTTFHNIPNATTQYTVFFWQPANINTYCTLPALSTRYRYCTTEYLFLRKLSGAWSGGAAVAACPDRPRNKKKAREQGRNSNSGKITNTHRRRSGNATIVHCFCK